MTLPLFPPLCQIYICWYVASLLPTRVDQEVEITAPEEGGLLGGAELRPGVPLCSDCLNILRVRLDEKVEGARRKTNTNLT